MATKRTYQPSRRRRQKKYGFLSRSKSYSGKKVLNKRRAKKRRHLSV